MLTMFQKTSKLDKIQIPLFIQPNFNNKEVLRGRFAHIELATQFYFLPLLHIYIYFFHENKYSSEKSETTILIFRFCLQSDVQNVCCVQAAQKNQDRSPRDAKRWVPIYAN